MPSPLQTHSCAVGEAPKPMTSKARRSSVQAYAANMSHTPAQRVLTTPLPSRPVDAYGTGASVCARFGAGCSCVCVTCCA